MLLRFDMIQQAIFGGERFATIFAGQSHSLIGNGGRFQALLLNGFDLLGELSGRDGSELRYFPFEIVPMPV